MGNFVKGAAVVGAAWVAWLVVDEDPVGAGDAVNGIGNKIINAFESAEEFVNGLDIPELLERLPPNAQSAPSFETSEVPQPDSIVLAEESDGWSFPAAGSVSYNEPTQSISIADGFARDTLSPVARNS